MGQLDWFVERSRIVLEDKWIRVRADDCVMPSGIKVAPYYVLEYGDWANVVALTPKREVVLVRQYRHGCGVSCLELPSGCIDEGEAPLDAAARELKEETGYAAGEIFKTLEIAPNPANQSNMNHCFLALNAEKLGVQKLDETEEIEVELHPLDSLFDLVRKGEILQSLHVSSILMALRVLEERGVYER
ncbi:MAG: NUDIX hydrolase [Verrucomicrobiota bacterium]